MATRAQGNWKLKAARLSVGLTSQQALADALTAARDEVGLPDASVGSRQVRRWESTEPPWPQAAQQRLLRHVLGVDMHDLGFTPPWEEDSQNFADAHQSTRIHGARPDRSGDVSSPHHGIHAEHPDSVAADFETMAGIYRKFYWTVDPHRLYPAVSEHVRLGQGFLKETAGPINARISRSLAEMAMLAGRIEFFDLREPDRASEQFLRALQFAGDAHDSLLGAAALAHSAFIPGWAADRSNANDRLTAARAHARRSQAPPLFMAWIDSVEAECSTRCGDTNGALRAISHAEDLVRHSDGDALPIWMDWFNPARLLAFKGNVLMRAGRGRRARDTLTDALEQLLPSDSKQRAIVLADLAAVEITQRQPAEAARLLKLALEQLNLTWYATAMERIRAVRQDLRPWDELDFVEDLDSQLFGWEGTFTAMRS